MAKKNKSIISSNSDRFILSDEELKKLVKTRQDFIEGETAARDWKEIEKDLDQLYN